jgi:septation ring formation regulator EzrA
MTAIRYKYQTHFLIDTRALFFTQRKTVLTRQRENTMKRLQRIQDNIADLIEECEDASPAALERAQETMKRYKQTETTLLQGIASLTRKIGDGS